MGGARTGRRRSGRIDNFGRTTRLFGYVVEWAAVDRPTIEDGRHEADDQGAADGGPKSGDREALHEIRRQVEQQRVQDHEEESEREDNQRERQDEQNGPKEYV